MPNKFKQLIDSNDFMAAAEYLDTLSAADAQTWVMRGKLQSRSGNMSEALSCYHQALHLDPNCGEARTLIEMANAIYDFRDPNLLNP